MEGVVLLSPYLKFSVFFQGVDGGFRPNANGEFEAGGNANVILYVGLGMVAVGLVITFVGLGDKGFQTLELKLIGPTLTGIGLFFALLRVLFCTLPSCLRSCRRCCCCGNSEEEEKLIKKEQEKLRNEVLAREQLQQQQQQKQLQESRLLRQQEKLQRHQQQRQRMPPPTAAAAVVQQQRQPKQQLAAVGAGTIIVAVDKAGSSSSNYNKNGTIASMKYNQVSIVVSPQSYTVPLSIWKLLFVAYKETYTWSKNAI